MQALSQPWPSARAITSSLKSHSARLGRPQEPRAHSGGQHHFLTSARKEGTPPQLPQFSSSKLFCLENDFNNKLRQAFQREGNTRGARCHGDLRIPSRFRTQSKSPPPGTTPAPHSPSWVWTECPTRDARHLPERSPTLGLQRRRLEPDPRSGLGE